MYAETHVGGECFSFPLLIPFNCSWHDVRTMHGHVRYSWDKHMYICD